MVRVLHGIDEQPVTPVDRAVAALALRQHGVVSTEQLMALGLGRGAIDWRVRQGRLHRIHRGVFAVGHARLTFRGRLWAAVLACGGADAAVVSHRSAAAVWDLLPVPSGPVDVITLRRSGPAGVRVHRSRTLATADVTRHDGLPLTTPARTLLDLAATLSPHRLERVVHRAEHLRLLDAHSLDAQLARAHGRRPKALTAALHTLTAHEPNLTRSELEERFLALIVAARLPRPETNARIHTYEVDFLWPSHRLIVETDGAATHLTPTAFEEDRRRDAALTALGYRVVRFTWRQVVEQPRATLSTLAVLLGEGG